MQNLDLRNHSDNELELWIDNDEYLHQQYQKAVHLGNLQYVLNTLEDMSMQYTDAQLDVLKGRYEDDILEHEKAQAVQTICSNVREYMAARNNYGPRHSACTFLQ